MTINQEELLDAFNRDGWLDLDTGTIVRCNQVELGNDGYNHYVLPKQIVANKDRYIRIPYFDVIQIAKDFFIHYDIPGFKLDKYGITEIMEYNNETYLFHTTYDGLKGISNERLGYIESQFYCMLEEDSKLEDQFHSFIPPVLRNIVSKWAKEMGFDVE